MCSGGSKGSVTTSAQRGGLHEYPRVDGPRVWGEFLPLNQVACGGGSSRLKNGLMEVFLNCNCCLEYDMVVELFQ